MIIDSHSCAGPRRLATAAIVCCVLLTATVALAGPLEDGRIAIIHASQSVLIDSHEKPRPNVLPKLRAAGVEIIGRYLGRCRQGHKGHWRWTVLLAHGGAHRRAEVNAILDAGFGIMSFYQYKAGDADGPRKFAHGLGEQHDPTRCENTAAAARFPVSDSPEKEGILDAQAAVKQAHELGQPAGTAIYFAADFNFDKTNPAMVNGVLKYFRQVRAELSKKENGYLVGGYGNGDVLGMLLGDNPAREKLIDLAWLSPSPAHHGSSKFHNTGRWNVIQSASDNKVAYTGTGECFDFEYDADVQNAASTSSYIGAWTRAGRYFVTPARTHAIYQQRRFVCDIGAVAPGPRISKCGQAQPLSCTKNFCFARVARIKPQDGPGVVPTLSIDLADRGRFNGRSPAANLTVSLATKPLWAAGPAACR